METHDRLHALDAVRAFALFAGIVLHATMSFFLAFPVLDSSPSMTLGITFFVIHIFRMSLFFFVAGFFAHMVFHRKGFQVFASDRAKRIAVPMVLGWLIMSPLLGLIMIWGLTRTYGAEVLATMEAPATGLALTHLWFLYYLCIFYVLALALRWLVLAIFDGNGRLQRFADKALAAILSSNLAPLVLALPTAVVFYLDSAWLPWTGIATPDMGLTPKVPALIAYGTAFGAGWLLHRQPGLLAQMQQRWVANLLMACGLSAAALWLVGPAPVLESPFTAGDPVWHKPAYIICYTLAIWLWSFGLIGAALRFFSKASALQRYLADSSYWLYIAHLPIVFFLQVALAEVNLHWAVKFPLILLITMTVLLLSYHYLVRSTFIGRILNGRRYPRSLPFAKPEKPDPAGPSGGRRSGPVAQLKGVTHRYGSTVALNQVSLSVERGELLAVLGPNGAGKSTAISLWLGLNEPDEGEVKLFGKSPLDIENRLEIGIMMQEANLSPELRARELIDLTASYYPDPMSVEEVIALAGIDALADKRYGKLSTGQKRQVQFATAICGRPQLLFLDEPTVGLDVKARETMWQLIRRLLDQGCSIVLTTHYLEEAEALADRVAVLARGELVTLGSLDEVRSVVTRRHIKCKSILDESEVRTWPGVVEVARNAMALQISAIDAEAVVRRLLDADAQLSHLEVKPASLADAFTSLTEEAA